MNFFGIQIERKTDILAFTAFIVSVLTAIYQLGTVLMGPKAQLLPPEAVTLVLFENSPGHKFISVVAPISISNTSNAQEPLLVTRQTAQITMGKYIIPLIWHDSIEVPIDVNGAQFEKTQALHPFIIDTKKISSQLVRFTPQRVQCASKLRCNKNISFMSMEDFHQALASSLFSRLEVLDVRFSIEFNNHTAVTATCRIPVMPNQLKLLNDRHYFMESCEKAPT
jgi:hypothetical protein